MMKKQIVFLFTVLGVCSAMAASEIEGFHGQALTAEESNAKSYLNNKARGLQPQGSAEEILELDKRQEEIWSNRSEKNLSNCSFLIMEIKGGAETYLNIKAGNKQTELFLDSAILKKAKDSVSNDEQTILDTRDQEGYGKFLAVVNTPYLQDLTTMEPAAIEKKIKYKNEQQMLRENLFIAHTTFADKKRVPVTHVYLNGLSCHSELKLFPF